MRYRKLENWMDNIVKNNRYKEFDDLHLDESENNDIEYENWIFSALTLFKSALKLKNKKYHDHVVLLVFHLREKRKPNGLNFKTVKGLRREMSKFTPPSLYLLKNESDYFQGNITIENIPNMFLKMGLNNKCTYVETFSNDFLEYLRHLVMSG